MKEYICKEDLINNINEGLNTSYFGHDAIEVMAEIEYMPAADVVEVVHGKWIDSHGDIVCSVCEAEYSDEIRFMNKNYKGELLPYCPNCSAKMDKED